MNFNKKSLLATAGVLAGVMAPVSSVFAAGGYDSAGTSADSGQTLPVFTSNSQNASTGTAKAWSVASVVVKTGFLQLNRVPNLNFMSSFEGGTTNLYDNTQGGPGSAGQDYDGSTNNPDGFLEVMDSRKSSGNGGGNGGGVNAAKTPIGGWKLQVSLGEFKNGNGTDGGAGSAWVLKLNRGAAAQKVVDTGTQSFVPATGFVASNAAPTGSGPTASPITVESGTAGNGTAVDVWVAAAGTGAGTTQALYHTAQTASLKIPAGVADGSYSAPITWTLTASV
ncbi:WxL domain-containing protein [Xylocopilactobacillus apicola]|uniref:WxL domain-containing protein n=1 Tax=Xylocopilactobacillus apicola TaxID=2932184 RepID=A0AAU9DTW7_9LACO|nr:WxL domain-containing protein [Xylocopilactobacillus apicola]BDR59614.1 hypothetical protein XA3_20550 [Xylocopilactobacillus apicola]